MGIRAWLNRRELTRALDRALSASTWESLQRDHVKEWEEKLKAAHAAAHKELWPRVPGMNPEVRRWLERMRERLDRERIRRPSIWAQLSNKTPAAEPQEEGIDMAEEKDPMVHQMTAYRLVPPREGQPGYEQHPIMVAAKTLGEALRIVDHIPFQTYSVTGIVDAGMIYMDVHKLPESGPPGAEDILHSLLHQHGTREETEDLVRNYFQKRIGRDCPCKPDLGSWFGTSEPGTPPEVKA